MSLISSTILVITITLSNGGTVVYELDKSIYTQRVRFTDNENKDFDCLTICQFNTSTLHEIVFEKGKVNHKSKSVSQYYNWKEEEEFYESLKPFKLEDHNGLESIKNISEQIKFGQFYIQVKELEDIYEKGEYSSILPIIDNYYIFAYLDGSGSKTGELVRPTDIKVVWSDSFSDYVIDNLTYITSKK